MWGSLIRLVACCALLTAATAGCAGPGGPAAEARASSSAWRAGASSQAAAQPSAPAGADGDRRAEVVMRAMSLLGVSYKFGGNTPETGLDCSGLVRLVFRDTLGTLLPRRSEEISRSGHAIEPRDLKPGDLVFFDTLRRAFSHVGIYIGNNQFVHAPASGGQVRVEHMGGAYWQARFNGARRLAALTDLPDARIAPITDPRLDLRGALRVDGGFDTGIDTRY